MVSTSTSNPMGDASLAGLITSLNNTASAVSRLESALTKPVGAGGAVSRLASALTKPVGAGGAGAGGPLAALSSIGNSWLGTAGAMAVGWGASQITQSINMGTASIHGRYDPAGGAMMAARAYDPLGPLKNIPFIGGMLQAGVERDRDDMTRNANIIGIMQSNQMNRFGENNSLAEQTVGAEISLNRQYSPAQVGYQQDMLRQRVLQKESDQWWSQKRSLYGAVDKAKAATEAANVDFIGAHGDDEATNKARVARSKAEGAYSTALSRYQMYVNDQPEQERKDMYTAQLAEQAGRRYQQATQGMYQPTEQANYLSTAIAPNVGGIPAVDPAIENMQITNTTLVEIKNLLGKYLDKSSN